MGGATSRFCETNWEISDGGLSEASQTIDGREPTESHVILTLKKTTLVNQREFEIRDDMDELLYTSKAVEGTTKWFDLFQSDGKKLFCVQTDAAHVEWNIYNFTPNWEGQEEDRKAKNAQVLEDSAPLYRKARINITWNKHHGEVHLFEASDTDTLGVVSKASVLLCEVISSITAQFQSYVPKLPLLDEAMHPPLSGWWVWEHSRSLHQMKMHLSKGTDVALHCVVAITCNMVNVEKEAGRVR